ncbi:tRNA pseudouridine(38-40) synthase TruA [Nocardioides sp. AE5]|uniref:tRNA pseudouridine(38-40) synthase TruA n=1 Tax=Nocardioides sp. AE5 TaxID=2962573 RepID=UPI002880C6D3|nr:tRNA pseudouridine(38-40) synthase TruA [Nocardioides sp. AE5]MDT0203657.1 tRNA pseudouridine(38-40) synthase TruA [Nocardioides sp. AE5]
MRIRIDLAYDGTDFKGWARQPALRTVQGEFEAALATVLRVPEVQVTCAGRTDTGVHARGQVLHLDLADDVFEAAAGRSGRPPLEALARRLNGILPADIRVRRTSAAPEGFDARFSAVWRRYAYRVADRAELVDPLTRGHVLAWPRELDVDAMNLAAQHLVGFHDFASFCKARDGATTIRTLLDLEWRRTDDGLAELTVRADAFCHNMVRALTGCLLAIGDGRQPAAWAGEILAALERDPRVGVVPAHGLTLEEVGYPDGIELIRQAERARNKREAP